MGLVTLINWCGLFVLGGLLSEVSSEDCSNTKSARGEEKEHRHVQR